MKAGDTLELELDALAPTGEASGRHEDRTVFVPGAFAGEQVSARVTHVSRQQPRAHTELRAILRPHPGRRASPCVHHDTGLPPRTPRCTGCPLLELDVADQRAQKRELLARQHDLHVDEVIAAPAELGYRHSSKRVVGGTTGQLVLGSYVRASHELAAMHACRVDHPEIVLAAEELRRIADWQKIEPFDERARTGDLRYAWLKTDGSEVLLTLVTASSDSRIPELAEHLRRPVGVAWSVHAGADNNLRGAAPTSTRNSFETSSKRASACRLLSNLQGGGGIGTILPAMRCTLEGLMRMDGSSSAGHGSVSTAFGMVMALAGSA